MNERIKELAEQAEILANKGDHVDVKIMMEKFAELIVKECANLCHKRKLTPSTFTGDEILEHFGVEK